MPLIMDQIDDFVETTLDVFVGKDGLKWVDLSRDLNHYIFADRMVGNKKMQVQGGPYVHWKAQVDNNGTARFSELFDKDQYNLKDLIQPIKVPWSKATANFSYDLDEDIFQEGKQEIVSELKVREHSMMTDFYELMEVAMWTAPSSSTATPRKPLGIPTWGVSSATAAFGFNGGNPSGFSSGVGELDASTYTRWKNGTFTYATISDDDMLSKVNEAIVKTNFRSPHDFRQLDKGYSWEMYTVFDVIDQTQRLLKNSNDNVGRDLGKYRGRLIYLGIPITRVPALEDTSLDSGVTNDPIYGINWSKFKCIWKKGAMMRRGKPQQIPGQHTTRVVHLDNWCQFACFNRREGVWVGVAA